MTIKEVEERTGLTRSNIRFYEKQGLVKPQRNTGNSYRDYSEKDIEELQKIAYLRTLGISIEEILQVVEKRAELHEIVKRQIPLLEQQLSELHNAKRMCETMLAQGEITYEGLEVSRYVDDLKEYWQENRQILRLDCTTFLLAWGGGTACVVIRFLLHPVIGTWIRRNTMYGGAVTDYVTNCLCFVVLSVEIFMILFVKGIVHHITTVLFVEVIILAGFIWLCRKELPVGEERQ